MSTMQATAEQADAPREDTDPITDSSALAALCEEMAEAPFVTVDTEFLRETTYYPKLCLIQIASDRRAAIIDPLADGLDLQPFWDLMANEAVMKVFHAARQDVEIMVQLGGVVPTPLFDTQVAAMVLGYGDQIAYDQLVLRIAKVRLDKSSRFTDWSRRPLSERQLVYALADVTHLRDVCRELAGKLAEREREGWVAEEMGVLTARETYEMPPEEAWRRLKMRLRKPAELAVMREVAAWRERTARERDVPRSRVIKDDAIFEIAQQQPRDAAALGRLRTVGNGFERSRAGGEILEAVERGLALPEDEMPRLERREPTPDWVGPAMDLLRVLLKLVAEREGVVPRLIASAEDLERLAFRGEQSGVRALEGWRRELFGEQALRLVRGELGLSFVDGRIAVGELAVAQ